MSFSFILQRTVFDGPILRNKGDIYFTDVAVTGSNEGTSDDPKFALLPLFKETIVPMVESLVGPGGQFAGYTPVLQGDQAGPHQDSRFNTELTKLIQPLGWLYEPQAPQMPHANNLDLAVFPAMSKRHSALTRECHSTKVLKKDEIFDAAVKVFNELPSSKIARGYVQCHRLMGKVIKENGGNSFVRKGQNGLSCGISDDFNDTSDGIKRKDGKTIAAPSADASMLLTRPHAPHVTF